MTFAEGGSALSNASVEHLGVSVVWAGVIPSTKARWRRVAVIFILAHSEDHAMTTTTRLLTYTKVLWAVILRVVKTIMRTDNQHRL